MRPDRRLVLAACLLSASVAGCPLLLSDDFRVGSDSGAADVAAGDMTVPPTADVVAESAADAPAESESSSDAANEADEGPDQGTDAGVEAGGPACCGTLLNDPLDETTFDHWLPRGVARGAPGYTLLNPEITNQAGAVFWPKPEALDDFELAFDFSITKFADATAPPADGLAFVAVSDPLAECEAGSYLCVVGMTAGFGVVLRTFGSAHEPPAPYVALIDTSRALNHEAGPAIFEGGLSHPDGGIVVLVSAADAAPPPGSWRTLCLRVSGGRATVKLGTQTLFSGVPLATLPMSTWGFVGATGAAEERNAVRKVQMNMTHGCGDAASCADASLCGN